MDDILPNKQKESELSDLQTQLTALNGEVQNTTGKIDNLTDSVADTNDKRLRQQLEKKLSELLDQEERFQEQKKTIVREIDKLSKSENKFREHLKSVEELWGLMESASDEELIEIRLGLREKLRHLIKRIHVKPVGPMRITREFLLEFYQKEIDFNPQRAGSDELKKTIGKLKAATANRWQSTYTIEFEGGSHRRLAPFFEPPLFAENIDSLSENYLHLLKLSMI